MVLLKCRRKINNCCPFIKTSLSDCDILKLFVAAAYLYFFYLVFVLVYEQFISTFLAGKLSGGEWCRYVVWKKLKSVSMSDQLTKAGLHFDELNKIRIIEPEVAVKSTQLKDEASEFVASIISFKKIADSFISIIDSLAQQVEKEKIKAIGAQNLVKSRAKQRDGQQQLQALLVEKTTELERLRIQHQSLIKTENDQLEMIDRLLLNH